MAVVSPIPFYSSVVISMFQPLAFDLCFLISQFAILSWLISLPREVQGKLLHRGLPREVGFVISPGIGP